MRKYLIEKLVDIKRRWKRELFLILLSGIIGDIFGQLTDIPAGIYKCSKIFIDFCTNDVTNFYAMMPKEMFRFDFLFLLWITTIIIIILQRFVTSSLDRRMDGTQKSQNIINKRNIFIYLIKEIITINIYFIILINLILTYTALFHK